jgi:nicotinamidase-related amidase
MHPVPLQIDDFIQRERAALVMWDMQKGLAGQAPDCSTIVQNARRLIDAAERLQIPVIWSRQIAPPLEMTTGPFLLWLMRKQNVNHPSKLKPAMQRGMEETEFVDGLSPSSHHIVLEKSQPSLFVDTPLAIRLKAMDRDTLVIAGVATDIGIEFTCRHAAALGYYSVVAQDATGSYTRESHERSLAFLRNWTTPVMPTATICSVWDRLVPGTKPLYPRAAAQHAEHGR